MGVVYATIKLSNPVMSDSVPIEVQCFVESGATYLCIPPHLADQLQLQELQKREVTLAEGSSILVPYVGPIKVEYANRLCFVGAMVLDDQTLLGAIPMEDMDLVILPKLFQLSVNPESPNVAHGLAK